MRGHLWLMGSLSTLTVEKYCELLGRHSQHLPNPSYGGWTWIDEDSFKKSAVSMYKTMSGPSIEDR